ncbi:HXXXD-type acyl-transferase family protein [Forsythia ovata]|uniref:HXXXD-type acyl-transferase family protein n=1 Tax=Forsythia ovata TaxID=205694 RepID=A0ABD1UWP0_9LAMI
MKVKIVSRKFIKPSTPTPKNLCTYKLSSMDKLNTSMNVVGILYYPQSHDNIVGNLNNLEKSLAQILPQFYPFAGRYIKDNHFVDCSDQGAEYVVAQVVDCELNEIIGSGVKPVELNDLLSMEVGEADEITYPILSVQITKFKCAGIAIGICISHRIIDACSFGTFISAWAKASLGDKSTEPLLRPNFDSQLYFPAENYDFRTIRSSKDTSTVTKRILFDRKAIATLRDKVSHLYKNSDRPPSRVLMVSSFLAEALLRSDYAKHGQTRPCLIMQEVNIRERTVPPLSKYSCGNLVLLTTVSCSADESKSMDFERLVPLLGNNVKKAVSDCAKILSNGEDGHRILIDSFVGAIEKLNESGINGLRFTDWSKFKFYEADFGFGKPIWTSVANIPIRNLVMLMNTKENDGIEAWVHLHEKDISYFEQDVEIKKLIS